MVVTFHLVVEDLGFSDGGLGEEEFVDEFEDFLAVFVEFILDFALVASEEADVLGALLFFFFLDGGKGSPGSSSGSDGVFVGDGKKIPFFNSEVGIGVDNFVHGFKHIFEPFSLFCDLGHVEMFFSCISCHNSNIDKLIFHVI